MHGQPHIRISKFKINLFFRFGALAAKTVELPVIWDNTPCSFVDIYIYIYIHIVLWHKRYSHVSGSSFYFLLASFVIDNALHFESQFFSSPLVHSHLSFNIRFAFSLSYSFLFRLFYIPCFSFLSTRLLLRIFLVLLIFLSFTTYPLLSIPLQIHNYAFGVWKSYNKYYSLNIIIFSN